MVVRCLVSENAIEHMECFLVVGYESNLELFTGLAKVLFVSVELLLNNRIFLISFLGFKIIQVLSQVKNTVGNYFFADPLLSPAV